jgi:hypothetical protein
MDIKKGPANKMMMEFLFVYMDTRNIMYKCLFPYRQSSVRIYWLKYEHLQYQININRSTIEYIFIVYLFSIVEQLYKQIIIRDAKHLALCHPIKAIHQEMISIYEVN